MLFIGLIIQQELLMVNHIHMSEQEPDLQLQLFSVMDYNQMTLTKEVLQIVITLQPDQLLQNTNLE
jgi:hypothetical protein